jgi:hypothetical protein
MWNESSRMLAASTALLVVRAVRGRQVDVWLIERRTAKVPASSIRCT